MKLEEIDRYFRGMMKIDELDGTDFSMNGVQVASGNGEPEKIDIHKIAFAVDACLESFERAADMGADMLFVHHGLFWGKPLRLSGADYRRFKALFEKNLVLYAAHLPLDMHPEFGNNAGICSALGIAEPLPFGKFRGYDIGFIGDLSQPSGIKEILRRIGIDEKSALAVLPFGPERITKVAVVSGGAADDVHEAIRQKADLFITGDAAHEIYHCCLENKINMISGGHYATETWGVRLLSEKVKKDLDLETVFIDLPTGL